MDATLYGQLALIIITVLVLVVMMMMIIMTIMTMIVMTMMMIIISQYQRCLLVHTTHQIQQMSSF